MALCDPHNSPNSVSFQVTLILSWPAVRKLLRMGVHPVWGNGQGLIVVAAYLDNLVKICVAMAACSLTARPVAVKCFYFDW